MPPAGELLTSSTCPAPLTEAMAMTIALPRMTSVQFGMSMPAAGVSGMSKVITHRFAASLHEAVTGTGGGLGPGVKLKGHAAAVPPVSSQDSGVTVEAVAFDELEGGRQACVRAGRSGRA